MSAPTITEPGVYDLPDDVYLADPVPGRSLSVSGARRLLPPYTPALFKYERDNGGRPPKSDFDFGHAAHHMLLGVGPSIKLIDAGDWRTTAAREARLEAYAAGDVPLLIGDFAVVEAMVTALRAHPLASALLARKNGKPEQSLFWVDEQSGIWLRGRIDWLPNVRPGKRLVIVDYKSASSAHPDKFSKSAADYGYAQQDAWYRAGIKALGLDADPAFVFVVQEKTAPYQVSVIELNSIAKAIGNGLNRRAIDIYATCVKTDQWPSYTDSEPAVIGLPSWYEREHEEFV